MSTMIRSTSFLAVRGARTTVTRWRTRFRWSTWKAGTVQSSTSAVVTVLPTPQKSDPWLLIHLHYLSFPHHWNHVYTYTICPSPTTEITFWSLIHLHCLSFPHHGNHIFGHFIHYVLPTPHKLHLQSLYTLSVLPTPWKSGLDHFIHRSWSFYTLSVLPTPYKPHPWSLYTICPSHTMEITSLMTWYAICSSHTLETT